MDTHSNVTLLDGGMGQELVRRSGRTPTPLWSATVLLEQVDLVQTLHEEFIQAGADIITVNAYTATPGRLARDADVSLFEPLQKAACDVARRAREHSEVSAVKVAGCLPPLMASFRPDLTLSRDDSLSQYRKICEIQAPYVDLFMCETMSSIAEALHAGTAANETGLPVCLSMTLDDKQPERLRSGELLSDALEALQGIELQAVMLNCSRPETICAAWSTFQADSRWPTGAYGNGFTAVDSLQPGGTVSALEVRNDLGPEAYADFAMNWVANGATLIGGCCEVGPSHIAHLRKRLNA